MKTLKIICIIFKNLRQLRTDWKINKSQNTIKLNITSILYLLLAPVALAALVGLVTLVGLVHPGTPKKSKVK